jgi:hypothetical protein
MGVMFILIISMFVVLGVSGYDSSAITGAAVATVGVRLPRPISGCA